MISSLRFAVAAAAAAALLAGCSSVPIEDNNAASSTPAGSSTTTAPAGNTGAGSSSDVKTVEVDPLTDPNSPLAQKSVYFALDSYSVDAQYDGMLSAHANYLVKHPARSIVIEGNTDARGSSEYNLALGQRRSEAVLAKLKLLGVPESRMEAVSFGKEKPLVQGSGEEAWSKNRRADIRYR